MTDLLVRNMSTARGLNGSTCRESDLGAHALQTLGQLNNMRLTGILVDVDLCGADGGRISAHRAVLAASSPYFHAMFGGRLRESTEREVVITDVDLETLRTLIEYIYTGVVDVDETNVESVLVAASFLQLEQVAAKCARFLLDDLDVSNCLGIRALADMLGSVPELRKGAEVFVERHFPEVAAGDEFTQLSASALSDLLQRDRLVVRSEREVFKACVDWLRHDWKTRRVHAGNILRHVRWPQLSADALAALGSDEELNFLREDPLCVAMLERAQWGEWEINRSSTVQRFSQRLQGLMFVIGGETSPGRRTVSSVEKYNMHSDTWESAANLPTPRRGAAAAVVNNILYVIGGSDGTHALGTVDAFNPVTSTWHAEESMLEKRSSVNAVVDRGVLYVAGGYNGISSCLNSVERFNPSRHTGKWSRVASMNVTRSMAGLSKLQRCIYAIGGYDGACDLQSCERYNVEEDSWAPIADMSTCR